MSEQPKATSQADRSEEARAEAPSSERVLIVDDNADSAELLASALAALGYATQIAHDGEGALKTATRYKPSTVFLDICLPVMDGYEIARRLRAERDLAPLRIIALTGYGQASDCRKERAFGFDEYVVKPIDIDALPGLVGKSRSYGK